LHESQLLEAASLRDEDVGQSCLSDGTSRALWRDGDSRVAGGWFSAPDDALDGSQTIDTIEGTR
jgi:hypothetical protein